MGILVLSAWTSQEILDCPADRLPLGKFALSPFWILVPEFDSFVPYIYTSGHI